MRHLSLSYAFVFVLAGCGGGSSSTPDAPNTPDAPVFPGPTLSASPGEGAVHLSWSAVTGATTYNIYRSDTSGMLGSPIDHASGGAADDTTVTPFQVEFYSVTATVGGVESQPSNQVQSYGYDFMHDTLQHAGYPLQSVAYAPANLSATSHDIYVAVGQLGVMLTSPDGATWTQLAQQPVADLGGVVFGNGLFVAVGTQLGGGTHTILTSPDGQSWTARDATTSTSLHAVTYSFSGSVLVPSPLFIAVGDNGVIVTSPDGITWTARACGTSELETAATTEHSSGGGIPTYQFMTIVAGNDVACYSTDGVTFTSHALTGTPNYISATNDDANSSVDLLSEDGTLLIVPYDFGTHAFGTTLTTTLPTPSGLTQYNAVTSYVDGANFTHIVVVRSDGVMIDSPAHGASGTFSGLASAIQGTLASGAMYADAVAAIGTTLFELGGSEQILRSTDGGATLAIEHDDRGGFDLSVAYYGGITVIDRGTGLIDVSRNGAPFTSSSTGSPAWPSLPLVVDNQGFVLTYFYGPTADVSFMRSPDATLWIPTHATVAECSGCTILDNGTIGTSNDYYATSWLELGGTSDMRAGVVGSVESGFSSNAPVADFGLIQIIGNAGSYLGLTSTQLYTSADGRSWQAGAPLPQGFIGNYYYDDGTTKFVVGDLGLAMASSDGIGWVPKTVDPLHRSVRKIARMGDHLIAVGDHGLIASSLDGNTWTPMTTQAVGSFTDLVVTDRGLVAIGQHDAVLTLP